MNKKAETSVNDIDKAYHHNLLKRKQELQKELNNVNDTLNDIDDKKKEFYKKKVNEKDKVFGPLIKSFKEIHKALDKPTEADIAGLKFKVYFTIGLNAQLSLGYDCGLKLSENNPKILTEFFDVSPKKWDELRKLTVPVIKEQTKDYVSGFNQRLSIWKEEYKTAIKDLGLASYMEKELLDEIVIAASVDKL